MRGTHWRLETLAPHGGKSGSRRFAMAGNLAPAAVAIALFVLLSHPRTGTSP